jgi:hypothetical protein
MIKAIPWDVTAKDWATGFDIKIDDGNENWELHIRGINKKRDYLFTDADRKRMHEIRDILVSRIND